MKSGRAACRPIEGEKIPTYKDFSVKTTTNGYRHLMKSRRAACRPIEGEEIPTYRDFLV